jgi:uncharacterized protein
MEGNLFPDRIIQFLGLLLASVVLAMPFTIFFGIDSLPTNELYQSILYVLIFSIFIGISFWINYRRKKRLSWNFRPVTIRFLYLMVILLFTFSIGINTPVNNFIIQILHTKTGIPNTLNDPYFVIGAVFIAPILEEMVFRGILLNGLLSRYSPRYAITLSALIFGLIHGKPLQMWGTFVVGLILGWIYFKTMSIGTTIILHSFLNSIVLFSNYLLLKNSSLISMNLLNIFLLLVSIPLTYIVTRQLVLKLSAIKIGTINKGINLTST